ncbi:Methyltransferase type 11 [Cordyceps militaris CM01]|uniref:Methyltransferase type 11 n=1 Tax=Cordyceps militaris (strain CM01) TaxID=983644 RepID=G3JRM8_CORMM|nr:Methyltransferase type 11 [Cordyceps militaris CM01]EGX88418.1 Methyltransferase type 11 [Cordyceps militaris CM01]
MATATDSVAQLYSTIATSEATRLALHPMEREITLRTIRAHLPAASAVADVGGGPGKLAFALADDGHAVDLVDLTPALVALAQQEQDARRASGQTDHLLRSLSVGNALHVSALLPAASYDGVLLLGPLYHLVEESERVAAVAQALQLARPGTGVVFCAFVSVAAHLRDIAVRDPAKLVRAGGFYKNYLRSGRYDAFKESLGIAVQGYHTCAADTRAFLEKHFTKEAELVELRSTEGILGGGLDAKLEDAGPEVVQAWASLMYDEYSAKEEYLGCADHLIAVLRRK